MVAVSQAVNRSLGRQRISPDVCSVIYDGINMQDYENPYPKEKLIEDFGLPENAIIFGNVGRFTENKSQLSLLEAFTYINETLPRLHLVLFGEGEMQDDLEDFVESNNLKQQVHFTGFRMDMPKWYAALDMLVHTATLEALSVALLEASASSVPMIAYNNGGVSEVIRHGVNGLLVQPRAVDQLAHAIERLAKKPELRRQMGKAAKESCERQFSAEQMIKQYSDLYSQIENTVE
jgi:glycosyltransferase involved in cell wall biosynthesis